MLIVGIVATTRNTRFKKRGRKGEEPAVEKHSNARAAGSRGATASAAAPNSTLYAPTEVAPSVVLRNNNATQQSSWLSTLPSQLLPGVLFSWMVMGVFPAIFYRVSGRQRELDQLGSLNLVFALASAALWVLAMGLYLLMSSREPERRAAASSGIEPRVADREIVQHTPRKCGKPSDAHKLAGRWAKVRDESDSLDEACAALRLNFIMRKAIDTVNTLELGVTDGEVCLKLVSMVSWFKVKESFPWDGSARTHRRRDFRSGGQTGSVHPNGPASIDITTSWNDPLAAREQCIISAVGESKLITKTTLKFADGKVVVYSQVFKRKEES